MNTSLITNIEFDGVDYSDAPDFCDAFVKSADIDGRPMTKYELDTLNDEHREFVYDQLIKYIY